jgi:hypothetical protein
MRRAQAPIDVVCKLDNRLFFHHRSLAALSSVVEPDDASELRFPNCVLLSHPFSGADDV